MNKTNLINHIAFVTELNEEDVKAVVDCFTETVVEVVAQGGEIKLKEFGVFKKKTSKERIGTNPKTKDKITIPEQSSIKFEMSKKLKETIK